MKELEDHSWFPKVLRNFQTEFIGFVVARFNIYKAFIQNINSLSLPVHSMTDLCSGSGEPAISIFKKSNCFSQLILTDKYPNDVKIADDRITYLTHPVDVLNMQYKPSTCYTMFNAFHHFSDLHKIKIVNNILAAGSHGFIVEILEPRITTLLKVLFATTIGTLLFAPFIRPFSLKRIFFTYIIPINVITITFDGIVSVFKSRSVKQYQSLFAQNSAISVLRLSNGFSPLVVIHLKHIK